MKKTKDRQSLHDLKGRTEEEIRVLKKAGFGLTQRERKDIDKAWDKALEELYPPSYQDLKNELNQEKRESKGLSYIICIAIVFIIYLLLTSSPH